MKFATLGFAVATRRGEGKHHGVGGRRVLRQGRMRHEIDEEPGAQR
jgi:hypothetical protein